MRTEHPTYLPRRALCFTAVLIAAIAASAAAAAANTSPTAPVAPPFALNTTCTDAGVLGSATAPRLVRTTRSRHLRSWTYGWPVKPFDRQHPVRGFLNDPRSTFHFGIDIAVPDGTAVYSVTPGTVAIISSEVVEVLGRGSSLFAYWHVVPAVRHGQHVDRHQLIAHVGRGWGHVHFAERQGTTLVNPLRNGGLGPYTDRTAPTVDEIGFDSQGLVVAAHDTPDPRVPGAWADEPVTPGLLEWRVIPASGNATTWRTAFDFRSSQLPDSRYREIYTRRTRGNHKGEPGQYCFYLQRPARTGISATVEVKVSDSAGNTATYATVLADFPTRL